MNVGGDVYQGSVSPYATSEPLDMTTDGGSGYFHESYLTTDGTGVPSINTTQDFCIEAWIYLTDTGEDGYNGIFGSADGNSNLNLRVVSNQLFVRKYTTEFLESASNAIQLNQWYHVAATRANNTARLFIDGVLVDSTSNSSSFDGGKGRVGAQRGVGNVAQRLDGYISDLRYVIGSSVYTSTFTPPTAPLTNITNTELLLNFQDAGIYDLSGTSDILTKGTAQVSTSVKKYGTGSIDLTGRASNKELSIIENGGSLTFGTGDFTVETWVYFLNSGGTQVFIDWRSGTGNQGLRPTLYLNSQKLYFYNGSNKIESNSLSSRENQWLHVALVRYSGQTKLYINGTQEGNTYTDSNNYLGTQDGTLYVGGQNGSYETDGYMDDIRITKGIARYTANFTPPTEALPTY